MTNQALTSQVINRPKFMRFVRLIKEISAKDAARRLCVADRTLSYYEVGKFPITDKIFAKVLSAYEVTDQEVRMYLEYHEGQAQR